MSQSVSCHRRLVRSMLIGVLITVGVAGLQRGDRLEAEDLPIDTATAAPHRPSLSEARARARLLHETIRGALQVMHRDFFDDENPAAIPSSSLDDVFVELSRKFRVQAKWLIVETDLLNVDHKPQNEFEERAAEALAEGQPEFEVNDAGTYRYAGPIRLASQCLKCHVKNRSDTETRTAGLVISMEIATSLSVDDDPVNQR